MSDPSTAIPEPGRQGRDEELDLAGRISPYVEPTVDLEERLEPYVELT